MTEPLPSPPHVVAVRISGVTGDADTEAVLSAIDEATGRHEHVALYAEVGWIRGVSPGQFVEDVREGLVEIARRARVERVAVVVGSYERRSVVRSEGVRAGGVRVAVFPPAARSAALDWAAEGGTPRVYVA